MTHGRQLMSARSDGTARGAARTARTDYAHVEAIEALEEAALSLTRRWKLGILCLLARGRYRYNALMRELPGATPKMLTQQLRSLEEEGLVIRYEYIGGGRHTEYALSPVGEHLVPVVEALSHWVSHHWRRTHGGVEEPAVSSSARVARLPDGSRQRSD